MNSGSVVEQPWTTCFLSAKDPESAPPGKQFNLVIDEEPLDNACHVWPCIILLKYGCWQALKVRKDNWLQHLGDVALEERDLSSNCRLYYNWPKQPVLPTVAKDCITCIMVDEADAACV